MEALTNTAWALVGSLITAAILGLWNWFYNRRNDSVHLTATIAQPGDYDVMQRVGCASEIITIKCVCNRIAKIAGAVIALEGVDLIPDLEKGFGASLGFVPIKG